MALERKDTTDTARSVFYFRPHSDIDTEIRWRSDICFVVVTIPSLISACYSVRALMNCFTRLLTRISQSVSLVEKELKTLPEHLRILLGLCCAIFSCLCSFLSTSICRFALFIEMPAQSYTNERSSICGLGVSKLSLRFLSFLFC